MSEYLSFINDFPSISVEVNPDKFDRGMPVLLIEACNIRPDNYEVSNLIRYSKVYSWNRQFLRLTSDMLPGELIGGFPLFDNNFWLDSFIPIEKRIHGICLIARKMIRHIVGDISHAREVVFEQIRGVHKHAYGKIPFCGEFYRGPVGSAEKETYPSSLAKLRKLNEYKFNLCFENCFHELWSYDYITEKIFDCFRAKTVPIYLGCYNIEDHIPADLFLDFRTYGSIEQLSEHLANFSDDTFHAMTERAYDWVRSSRWGDVNLLRAQLSRYSGSGCCATSPF